jgi:hypothetical protein
MSPTDTAIVPNDPQGWTVPDLARTLDGPLDRLRLLIRRNESLQKLLVKMGPTRLLPGHRLESFRQHLTACSSRSGVNSPASSAS